MDNTIMEVTNSLYSEYEYLKNEHGIYARKMLRASAFEWMLALQAEYNPADAWHIVETAYYTVVNANR